MTDSIKYYIYLNTSLNIQYMTDCIIIILLVIPLMLSYGLLYGIIFISLPLCCYIIPLYFSTSNTSMGEEEIINIDHQQAKSDNNNSNGSNKSKKDWVLKKGLGKRNKG